MITNYIRQSLTARLSIWVLACVVMLFVTALGILFYYSREAVKDEAVEKATQTLEGTMLHVENTLHEVEVAANNMKWLVEQHIDTPDSMFTFSRKILETNPNLNGCSIAFEPYYYPEKGRYFSAYSYNGDSIETEQEGNELYDYHCMDWYLIPKLLDKPYWVEPFQEYDTGGIQITEVITSFCQPIHDSDNKVVGVLSVDLSLQWFSNTISEAKPFPNSYSILLGKGGAFLVHPDSTKLFYETIFTPTLLKPDTLLTSLGEAMLAGESGYKVFHRQGQEDQYVFYKPFAHTDWSVAIVCSESDIFEPYNSLQRYLMAITIIGLFLLLFFCIFVIRRSLRPLKMLANSAQHISNGEFEEIVPESHRYDEIGHLQRSFAVMRRSLAEYIGRMRHSTETLTQRNRELMTANELAKEADRVKTAFINNMTDQMAQPVSIIASESDMIREGHQHFSDEEMKEHVDKMLENTEIVTILLNQLLDASQNGAPTLSNEETPAL